MINQPDRSNHDANDSIRLRVILAATLVSISIIGFAVSSVLILRRNESAAIRLVRTEEILWTVSVLLLIVGAWALYNVAPRRWRHPLAAVGNVLLLLPMLWLLLLTGWGLLSYLPFTSESSTVSDVGFAFSLFCFFGLGCCFLVWRIRKHISASRSPGT